jgi:hypothetical protein
MTIIGTDASYRSGGPQVPLQEESQASAAVSSAKQRLGIVGDSLQNIGNPLQNSSINTEEENRSGHFKSEPGRPTLAPLQHMRMGDASEQADNTAWKEQYDALVKDMPPQAQAGLGRSYEERGSSYGALNNVTEMAARTLVWTEAAAATPIPGTAAADRATLHQLQPYVALQGSAQQGNEAEGLVQEFLEEAGPNNPAYGAWQEGLVEHKAVFDLYGNITERAVKGSANEDDTGQLCYLAGRMQGNATGRETGAALLEAQQAAGGKIAGAFRNPQEAAPSLLLGVSIASIGTGDGSAGDSLSAAQSVLLKGATQAALGGLAAPDQGAQKMLLSTVRSLALACSVSARAVTNGSLGPLPTADTTELQGARQLELALTLQIALKSGLPQALLGGAATAAGVPAADRQLAVNEMVIGALLWTCASSCGADIGRQAQLLEGSASSLQGILGSLAEEWAARAANSGEPKQGAAAAYLQQAHTYAEKEDMEGCLTALWSSVALLDTTPEATFSGMQAAGRQTDQFLTALQGGDAGGTTQITLAV